MLLALLGCGTSEPAPAFRTVTFDVMHTRLRVTLPDGPSTDADAEAVRAAFAEVEQQANEWKPDSPLAAVTRAAGGEAVPVPDPLRALLHRAIDLARATDGAFDPTWAPLWPLWDFAKQPPVLPDPAQVAAKVALVDWRKLELDDAHGTARLAEPGMALGLGAIAKGWALDRAADALQARGVRDFCLDVGQVLAHGTHGGRPWRVGIRDPRGPADDAFAELEVRDASVSTSGDYERFFELDGARYHHILDPRTGWPAKGLRSATVLAPEGTVADALSTALMVAGPERALALATELHVEAVIVDDHGAWRATPGLGARLVVRHPPGQ